MVLSRDQRAAQCRGSPTMEEYDTNVNESPPGQQRSQTTVSTLTTSNTVRTSNQEDELEANADFMGGGGGFDDNDIGGGMRVRRCYLH